MSSPIPALIVDGVEYRGWTALRVQTSIDRAASAFTLEVTERWQGADLATLRGGLPCELRLDGETVINGWIDRIRRGLGRTDHTVSVTGRDATGDLVDCSAIRKSYKDQTLLEIARDQLAPFCDRAGRSMPVALSPGADGGKPFARVAVDPGVSVFDFLEKLARQRGFLLMPDGSGGLLLGHPGLTLAPVALEEGKNLLDIWAESDWTDRYSDYIVYNQSAGSDERHGEEAAHLESQAQDAEVAGSRHRLLMLSAEEDDQDPQERAAYEMRVRMGRSLKAGAQVQGWQTSPGGPLWRAGQTAQVRAPGVQLAETLLIVHCTYSLSERGSITDMELTRPGAWEPKAPLSAKTEEGWWK